MDGLTAKTPRQLRRPSKDAPTLTHIRRVGLFRLPDARQAEAHCPPLPEQERSPHHGIFAAYWVLFCTLSISPYHPSRTLGLYFILLRVWLTSGPPLPRQYDENPTRTTRTCSVLRYEDRLFLSDLGEAGEMIFCPGRITLALTQPPHSFDGPIFFVTLIVLLLPLHVIHSRIFLLADDSLCSYKSLIATAPTASHGLFFLL